MSGRHHQSLDAPTGEQPAPGIHDDSEKEPPFEVDRKSWRALEDVVDFAAAARRLVARGRQAYDRDEALRFASEALIYRIGEAVGRVDETVKLRHPDVRWKQMRAMRNIVAHQYHLIDPDIMWATLATELPKDSNLIQQMLDN